MPAAPDVTPLANRLAKNLAHWRKWARRRGIGCFRLYDRDVPQFPFAIDWYETLPPRAGVHLHVQEIDTGWRIDESEYTAWMVASCDAICAACGIPVEHLHLKRRERQRGVAQYEKIEDASQTFTVEEAGHRFEVNFDAYLDTGLFIDHRQTRAIVAAAIAVRARAGAGTRFLNLFAYTGSFSVYAALAGAEASLTVDLSNTYQAWTARNFTLNGLDQACHALARADAMAWLESAAKDSPRFDVIMLDPPSFSNSKKMQGVLDVQRDQAWLVRQCHALLDPGGELYFSTNLRSFALEPALAERYAMREITTRTVPEDYRRAGHPPPHRAWHLMK